MEEKKVRVVTREYGTDSLNEEAMDFDIAEMYNDPAIRVLSMNIVYKRTRFSENGQYIVKFVVTDK